VTLATTRVGRSATFPPSGLTMTGALIVTLVDVMPLPLSLPSSPQPASRVVPASSKGKATPKLDRSAFILVLPPKWLAIQRARGVVAGSPKGEPGRPQKGVDYHAGKEKSRDSKTQGLKGFRGRSRAKLRDIVLEEGQ